jgi:hypothetical protein
VKTTSQAKFLAFVSSSLIIAMVHFQRKFLSLEYGDLSRHCKEGPVSNWSAGHFRYETQRRCSLIDRQPGFSNAANAADLHTRI